MEQDELYFQVLSDSIENHNFKDHAYRVLYNIFLYIYLTSFFLIQSIEIAVVIFVMLSYVLSLCTL